MKSAPTCDVAIGAEDHDRLMAHLYPGDGDEYGAVLRAGIVSRGAGLRLLVNAVEPARVGTDYVPGKYGYRALAPTFIHRQIVRCRDERMAYLAVAQSRVRQVRQLQQGRHGLARAGLSGTARHRQGRAGRRAGLWPPGGGGGHLAAGRHPPRARVVPRGRTDDQAAVREPSAGDRGGRRLRPAGAHVRQCRAGRAGGKQGSSGGAGRRRLPGRRISRAPRRGSPRPGRMDEIEDTNLSRVVGATPTDVETGQFKTQIAVRHLREARPDILLRRYGRRCERLGRDEAAGL